MTGITEEGGGTEKHVDHYKLWKILKETEIPDHLTCLLGNLYAGTLQSCPTLCDPIDCSPPGSPGESGLVSRSKATLWVKAQHEGALPPPCIVRKDPRARGATAMRSLRAAMKPWFTATREKPSHSNKDPAQPKQNKPWPPHGPAY